RSELEILEARHSCLRERLECKVLERLAANCGKLGAEPRGALVWCLLDALEEALQPPHVDLFRFDGKHVSGGLRADEVAAERPAQLGHVVLERVTCGLRRMLS